MICQKVFEIISRVQHYKPLFQLKVVDLGQFGTAMLHNLFI